jgi:hypothetical protein
MGGSESGVLDPLNNGYRIYHLIKNGPLDVNGINELSDFIIPSKDVLENKFSFVDWVTSNAGKELKIKIYSLKTRTLKELTIKANEKNSKDGILGGSVRYENWSIAHKKVLHIISVEPKSFAEEKLHLISNEDYIIAVQPIDQQIISLNLEESDPLSILGMIIQNSKGKECNFYIYNKKLGARRENAVIGVDDDFKLGIEGAYGALHEFPFDDIDEENDNVDDNEIINNPIKMNVIDEKNEGDNVNNNNESNEVKISNIVVEKNDNVDDLKKNESVEEKKDNVDDLKKNEIVEEKKDNVDEDKKNESVEEKKDNVDDLKKNESVEEKKDNVDEEKKNENVEEKKVEINELKEENDKEAENIFNDKDDKNEDNIFDDNVKEENDEKKIEEENEDEKIKEEGKENEKKEQTKKRKKKKPPQNS